MIGSTALINKKGKYINIIILDQFYIYNIIFQLRAIFFAIKLFFKFYTCRDQILSLSILHIAFICKHTEKSILGQHFLFVYFIYSRIKFFS